MMKFIRWFLGKLILFLDAAFAPKAIQRSPEEQARVDRLSANLSLYQFEACPFCVKVRRGIKKLNLRIELRDAKKIPAYAEELVQGGGLLQVPCLRIQEADGSIRWLYESSDILNYLEDRFSPSAQMP